jgi:hypothetical protein
MRSHALTVRRGAGVLLLGALAACAGPAGEGAGVAWEQPAGAGAPAGS